ncbi:MAG: hypothetical protein ABI318_13915, partial [Chthoniobacteraceae bacterium]
MTTAMAHFGERGECEGLPAFRTPPTSVQILSELAKKLEKWWKWLFSPLRLPQADMRLPQADIRLPQADIRLPQADMR